MALDVLLKTELGSTGKLISFEKVTHGVSDAMVIRISPLIDTTNRIQPIFMCINASSMGSYRY